MRHVSIIALSLLLTACGQRQQPSPVTSDADIQKRLSGTWTNEMTIEDGHWKCVTVYRSDGTYAGESTVVRSHETQTHWASESGTFVVKGGVLIMTMTRHSQPNARVPRVDRIRIVRLDDRELVVQDEERPDLEPVTSRRGR